MEKEAVLQVITYSLSNKTEISTVRGVIKNVTPKGPIVGNSTKPEYHYQNYRRVSMCCARIIFQSNWRAPLKVNDGGQSYSNTSRIRLVLNIWKLYKNYTVHWQIVTLL